MCSLVRARRSPGSSDKVSCKKIEGRFRDQTKLDAPPKEEESNSQDIPKRENKKDNMIRELREVLTRKAGSSF
jgi:hypothetical protein